MLLCVRPLAVFRVGRRYLLAIATVSGDREILRRRWRGGVEKVRLTGGELAVKLRDADGHWHAFSPYGGHDAANPHPRHHATADLLRHFHIPAVPDVATVHQEHYQRYRAMLQRGNLTSGLLL